MFHLFEVICREVQGIRFSGFFLRDICVKRLTFVFFFNNLND
jgi:hypothetical protein